MIGMLFLCNFSVLAQTLLKKAESGDMVAQYLYADSLTNWHPEEGDYKKAVIWLEKSAKQGYAWGQYNYGWCLLYGVGIEQDEKKAIKWFEEASKQGNEDAKNMLQNMRI